MALDATVNMQLRQRRVKVVLHYFSNMNLIYHIYRDSTSQWRWYLTAGNNRKIATSGEAFHNKADCVHSINLVAASNGAPIRED